MNLRLPHTLRLLRNFGLFTIYTWLAKIIITTFVTYFAAASRPPEASSGFSDILDGLHFATLPLLGITSSLFIILSLAFSTLSTDEKVRRILNPFQLKRLYLPGLGQGLVYGVMVIAALILTGAYQWFGVLVRSEEAFSSFFSIFLRASGIIFLIYSEEYIFREYFLNLTRNALSLDGLIPERWPKRWVLLGSAMLNALFYVGIKWIQLGFTQIGILQSLTLGILCFNFSLHAKDPKTFSQKAGFFTGLLLLIHVFASLPILGFEFTGIFLVKDHPDESLRFLSGGQGGPLSSMVLQFLIILDTIRVAKVFKRKHLE